MHILQAQQGAASAVCHVNDLDFCSIFDFVRWTLLMGLNLSSK